MNRKVVAIWLTFLMGLSFIVIIVEIAPIVIAQTTWYVDDIPGSGGPGDPPEDFTSIQDAINASIDGDTVFVYNGTYYENVIVNKTLNLTGENRNETVIDGSGFGDVVKVEVDWVNVSGFTVIGDRFSGKDGIVFNNVDNCSITYSNISSHDYGINMISSLNNIVEGNIVTDNRYGIYISLSHHIALIENCLSLNLFGGISLLSSTNSSITNNNVSSNEEGIALLYSTNIDFQYNNVSSNTAVGLSVFESSNCTIIGNNISTNYYGLGISSSSLITIKNNNVISNINDGIEISSSSNIKVVDNNISSNKWNGLRIHWSLNVNITMNRFFNDGVVIIGGLLSHYNSHNIPTNNLVNGKSVYYYKNSSGFDIDGAGVGQLILANCSKINVSNLHINNTDIGIIVANSTNISLISNNVSFNDYYGICFVSSSYLNITANNIFSNNFTGLYLGYSHWAKIANNNISSRRYHGIKFYSSSNNNITNNNIISNSWRGIYLYSSPKNDIIMNNVISNDNEGIFLMYSDENNIIGNNVSLNWWGGFTLEDSSNCNVINNIISSNDGFGIRIWKTNNTNVTGNNVNSNNSTGFLLDKTNFNNITCNNVSYNRKGFLFRASSNNNTIFSNSILSHSIYGIHIDSSSINNLIYHNNFLNNSVQAYDYTNNSNQWDYGYPSGGNFWSDYSGIDNFFGPGQNLSGSDGIGDTPYVIDSDSKDNYPLMAPIGDLIFLYEGWNLISIPFIFTYTNLSVVLNSIKGSFDAVQWFNITNNSDHWKHNNTKKPSHLNDLDRIDYTMGFWIHIIEPGGVLFDYLGTQPTSNQTIPLHPGWNMVGYSSLTSYNRTVGLNNLTFDMHVDAIWTYNAAAQRWKKLGEYDYFIMGRGYYIHAKSECEWEVPL